MLKKLLPTTFPTAIVACPLKAEIIETASSGELVPKATTVNPTISGEIFKTIAIRLAPRTKHSAPKTSKPSPPKKRIIVKMPIFIKYFTRKPTKKESTEPGLTFSINRLLSINGGLMKKLIMVALIMSVLFVLSCKKADSLEGVMDDFMSVMNNYITNMEKANSADDVVRAIEKYTAEMKLIAPRLKKISEKYSQLNSPNPQNLPPELQKYQKKIEELASKMFAVMGKMMQYGNDPKVQEASKKMNEAMEAMK